MSEYVCIASNGEQKIGANKKTNSQSIARLLLGIPPDESWQVKLHVTFEPVRTLTTLLTIS